jgi:Zn-dependent protease
MKRQEASLPVRISGGFLLFLSFLVFFDPGNLLPHFLIACLAHELGHLAALQIFGGRVRGVVLTAAGAELELFDPNALSYPQEILAVLSGPAAGVGLAFAAAKAAENPGWEELFILAGISLSLSLFNLLPVRALDGGQALWLLLSWLFGPARAESASRFVSLVVSLLLAASGGLIFYLGGSGALLLASGFLVWQSLCPARPGRIA